MQFFKKVSETFKRSKALRVICLCVVIVAAVLAIGGIVVNKVAGNKLRSALANVPGVKIDFEGLNLSLLAGNLELTGVEVALPDTAEELARLVWENLNADNKASLFVRAVPLAGGRPTDIIINKNI